MGSDKHRDNNPAPQRGDWKPTSPSKEDFRKGGGGAPDGGGEPPYQEETTTRERK
ncbi:MAG: hypothetical protein OXI05_01165 [Bacteroidota bacterium]|nr:hypothetical protein [Bacteroidota bacterium]